MLCKDKIALVTGAAKGIGLASCQALAAAGAVVVVSDVDHEAAQQLAEALRDAGRDAMAVALDVRDEKQWAAAMAAVTEAYGGLDILVNNAGIAVIKGIEDETLEGWSLTQAINSDGVFLGCRAAVGAMKQRGGSIVNLSSIEGIVGDPMLPAYNASKGAVRALSKSVALYCCDRGYPIRVNSLHPGYVETSMVSGALAELSTTEAEQFSQRVLASIPMGRMARAEEIAAGVVFLASESAAYMTGAELIMDGGYTAR